MLLHHLRRLLQRAAPVVMATRRQPASGATQTCNATWHATNQQPGGPAQGFQPRGLLPERFCKAKPVVVTLRALGHLEQLFPILLLLHRLRHGRLSSKQPKLTSSSRTLTSTPIVKPSATNTACRLRAPQPTPHATCLCCKLRALSLIPI